MDTIEADYLVVGAGAMGMAFVDTIIAETNASVVVVDRGHRPGGHWTVAYPFVRLHQPSSYYGVNSLALGGDTIDRAGWNEGLYELATSDEVCAYFDRVMQQQFLPTGRVSYFPTSEYLGGKRFRTLAGEEQVVRCDRVVDATYLRTVVPAMRPPPYRVAAGVDCVPPNDLPRLADGRVRYVVVGAGKTGFDACLWLLRQNIPPERLTWVMPRDSWLLDRALIQPGPQFVDGFRAAFAAKMQAVTDATSVEDLFDRLESSGNLLRLDPAVRPSMYRCSTVSRAELEQLRRITDVVRMGRVESIEPDRMELTDGSVAAEASTLYIDCSADGLQRKPGVAVFDSDRITLQSVRGCQQVFSAAFIGHIEAAYEGEDLKNDLCVPVPHPDSDLDWLSLTLADNRNQMRWFDDPELMAWLAGARLNFLRDLFSPIFENPRVTERALGMIKPRLTVANERLEALLDGWPAKQDQLFDDNAQQTVVT